MDKTGAAHRPAYRAWQGIVVSGADSRYPSQPVQRDYVAKTAAQRNGPWHPVADIGGPSVCGRAPSRNCSRSGTTKTTAPKAGAAQEVIPLSDRRLVIRAISWGSRV